MAFLMGTERIIYEHSDMMIHSYTGGAYGKRQDMLDQAIHQDKMLNTFFTKIYSQYFTKKEIKKLLKGQDFWLDTQDIIKRKICTGIVTDDGVYYTLKDYKKMLKGKK
jgi:ATP-dependent protease ClpP protease subunit